MDQKEKRKHKFNFVDAIIIAVVLLVIAAIAFIFVFGGAAKITNMLQKDETVTIRYAVEVTRVKDDFVERNIASNKEGTEVIDEVRTYNIGNYIGYIQNPSEVIGTGNDGKTVVSKYPGYSSVIIIIEAEATRSDHMYLLDGYDLQVGRRIDFSVGNFAGNGYCIALDEIKDEADEKEFYDYVNTLYEKRVFTDVEQPTETPTEEPTETSTEKSDKESVEESTEPNADNNDEEEK